MVAVSINVDSIVTALDKVAGEADIVQTATAIVDHSVIVGGAGNLISLQVAVDERDVLAGGGEVDHTSGCGIRCKGNVFENQVLALAQSDHITFVRTEYDAVGIVRNGGNGEAIVPHNISEIPKVQCTCINTGGQFQLHVAVDAAMG